MILHSNINSYNLKTHFPVTSSQTTCLANEMRLWCGMQPGEHLRRAGCILGSRRRARSTGAPSARKSVQRRERGLIRDLLTCRERGFIENLYYVSALGGSVRVRRESSIRRTTSDCVAAMSYFCSTGCSTLRYVWSFYVAQGEKRLEARRQAPCVCT